MSSIHRRKSFSSLLHKEDPLQVFYSQKTFKRSSVYRSLFYTQVLCEEKTFRGLLLTDLYFRNSSTPMVQYLVLLVPYVLFLCEFLKYFSVQLSVYYLQQCVLAIALRFRFVLLQKYLVHFNTFYSLLVRISITDFFFKPYTIAVTPIPVFQISRFI